MTLLKVGDGDFFWEANGRAQFPKMAEDVDVQLNKYKAAVEELNRKTGANVDANMDPNELMQVVTGSLPVPTGQGPSQPVGSDLSDYGYTCSKRVAQQHANYVTDSGPQPCLPQPAAATVDGHTRVQV